MWKHFFSLDLLMCIQIDWSLEPGYMKAQIRPGELSPAAGNHSEKCQRWLVTLGEWSSVPSSPRAAGGLALPAPCSGSSGHRTGLLLLPCLSARRSPSLRVNSTACFRQPEELPRRSSSASVQQVTAH